MITFDSFSNCRSLKFADATGQRISMIVDIAGVGNDTPFTASETDPEEYGRQIFNSAMNAEYGEIAPYTAPVIDPVQAIAVNTAKFNRLLIATSAAAFPLQSAITLGIATSEDQSALAALQQYSIDLANTDLSQNPAAFPAAPAGVKLPI